MQKVFLGVLFAAFMTFLIPAVLSSIACIVYKIGLLVAKVRQRRMEGSLNDHKGYLASYLKRAQNRSLKALQGGVSHGMANITQGVSKIGKELPQRALFVRTHKESPALPISVSNTSKLDEKGLQLSTASATEQGAPEHTVDMRSSAPMYVHVRCMYCCIMLHMYRVYVLFACCEYIRQRGKRDLKCLINHHMLASDRRSFFERESENTVMCKRVYCSMIVAFLEDLPFVVLNLCLVIRPFMASQPPACPKWVIDQNKQIFTVCKMCFSVLMLTRKLTLLKDFPGIWATKKALMKERKELDQREIELFGLFHEGERVTHKNHGDGTVVRVNLHDAQSNKHGEKFIYTVVFDNAGRHRYSELSSEKLARTGEQLRPLINLAADLVKGTHVWHATRGWGAIEAVNLKSERGNPSSMTEDAKRITKSIVVSHSDGISSHYTAKQATKSLKVLDKEAQTTNTCTQLICYHECKV